MNRRLRATAALAVLAMSTVAGGVATASSPVTQPPPPVTAAAFPQEPTGVAPADHDGRIPNPTTPTGTAVAPPGSCAVTFDASGGATSATVNAWIASHANALLSTTVVCLAGTFTQPLHVWNKTSRALLELAPTPGRHAVIAPGTTVAADSNANQLFDTDAGAVSIVDSRSVEVFGLTVAHYTFNGTARTPAGIYVAVRSDTASTNQSTVPHLSACFLHGGSCADIYLINNTITGIANTADQTTNQATLCGSRDVNAYGIAVIAAGSSASLALQHVVIEGNTVSAARTGQSETVTLNGNITDFLAAGNTIHDVDNIGLDTIGWEIGASQANHGHLLGNTIYNVDTSSNAAYGVWNGVKCVPGQENAAGIYDDGSSYIWIDSNKLWNTNQGINLDVETINRRTDHLLVSGNVVHDDPGTSAGIPSTGTNPPGVGGSSTVAGHDPVAFFVDAFATGSTITNVYAHDNTFQNESQHTLQAANGMPVVDLGGTWSNVQFWHNTVEGQGPTDLYNPLFQVDQQPAAGTSVINCNDYRLLSTSDQTVNGNFALLADSWLALPDWQAGNGHGWDAASMVGAFSTQCPSTSIQ